MKIIGHRGAAGLALENSLESIKEGVKAGADYIEIDIRQTRDNEFILSHDPDLKRTYGVDLKIADHSLRELRIPCPKLPTLEDALKFCGKKGVYIELKEFIEPERLFKILRKYPELEFRFASFNHNMIRAIKKYNSESFCYVLEHHSPFEIIKYASKMKADGIGLHYAILNPLTYFLASRKKLHIYVYWLNKEWVARMYKILYRNIYICTDYPNVMRKYKD